MTNFDKAVINKNNNNYSLNIHNQGSPYSELFELKVPYAFLYEILQPENNYQLISLISPCDYKSYTSNSIHGIINQKHPVPHQHDFFEVMFVLEGKVIQMIENRRYIYEAGQCCVMNRNIKHLEERSTHYKAVFLLLSDEFLHQVMESDIQYTQDGSHHGYFNEIGRLIKENERRQYYTAKEYIDFTPITSSKELLENTKLQLNLMMEETIQQKPGSYSIVKGLLSRFFSILEDDSLYKKTRIYLTGKKGDAIFVKISRMLEASNGRVTREELRKHLSYNDDYLNRIIKNITGMTLKEYGQIFCLHEAERLLLNSEKSISEIIQLLGFSNRTYFYRLFSKKYGMTPKEYRNRYHT